MFEIVTDLFCDPKALKIFANPDHSNFSSHVWRLLNIKFAIKVALISVAYFRYALSVCSSRLTSPLAEWRASYRQALLAGNVPDTISIKQFIFDFIRARKHYHCFQTILQTRGFPTRSEITQSGPVIIDN